jgi:hypothetical protein
MPGRHHRGGKSFKKGGKIVKYHRGIFPGGLAESIPKVPATLKYRNLPLSFPSH